MAITVSPTNATLGAVVTDIDLETLGDRDWSEIYKAFLEYGLLIFPNQNLSEKGQGNFALRFGDTEKLYPAQKLPTLQFSNKKADGELTKPGEPQYHLAKGNEGWHTDSTYMPLASKAAMLCALVVPPEGGETEFADMRAAYDVLSAEMKTKLSQLSAYHSLYYSQSKAGFTHTTDNLYGFHDKGAPLRAVVKTHPETGRKSIYTGRHAYGIVGMTDEASEAFLTQLLDDACQAPRVYTHSWNVGDIVVWDNRCLMHRARPFDPKYQRTLRASRISGEPDTELASTHEDPRAEQYSPSSVNESSLVV